MTSFEYFCRVVVDQIRFFSPQGGILFDDPELIQMFEESLKNLRKRLCRNSFLRGCVCADGYLPVYWNTDMYTGDTINAWIDTLQSAWPGILVSITL